MRCRWSALVVLVACNQPALQNAPRPNPSAVAGAAAGAAAAATLADPDGAAKHEEEREKEVRNSDREHPAKKVTETVPADVLDRLDQAAAAPLDAGVE